jgi:hypothetical protein
MLAINPISDAIMIDVDYLNFGKLISSADGLSAAPEGLGVTSRSRGLKAEHDGELRLNTLLEVQVFSPAMIDAKLVDKGLLLVRTLPRTAAAPRGRTVFVRARFRQESSTSSDSRPHQQASIWVLNADMWYAHPAAILAKVGKELEAEPDSADGRQRFGAAPKEVMLAGTHASGEDTHNAKWRYAYYCILDMLLREIGSDARPHDREITFGSDVFGTEAEFLAVVGGALQDLPLDFERWKDIRIGSGMRSSGGLIIRYLPSEEKTMTAEISQERVVSIRRRREREWGGQPVRAAKATLQPISPTEPATGPAVATNASAAVGAPATGPSAKDAARDFQFSLTAYQNNPNRNTARDLMKSAEQVESTNAIHCMESLDNRLTFAAISSMTREPRAGLPLGALYDRVLFLSRLPSSPVADQWFEAFLAAISKAGVLLPKELGRLQGSMLDEKLARNEKLRETYKNSQELRTWLKQVQTNPDAALYGHDLGFLRKLRGRLDAILAGLSYQGDRGIHRDVIIGANLMLSPSELFDAHGDLLKCAVANLYNALSYQGLAADKDLVVDSG